MPKPFWHIIANPVAGGGAVRRRWPLIEKTLQELGFDYTVQFTRERGHAIRLVEDAVLNGGRYLMAIGGDGTNHEVVNGIFQQNFVDPRELTYALLPVGTGNDWAREYDIPHDPQRRLKRLLEGHTRWQDVGKVRYQGADGPRERFFVNVAGMAYDAFIARKMDEQHRRPARFVYLLMVAKFLFDYRLVPARILFDDQRVEDHFYTINIGLCRYSGGGMQLVPHAVPDDGLLALTFARRLPKLEVLAQTHRFYNRTILQHPKIEGYQVKALRVEHEPGTAPTLLEADGEFLGETPAEFFVLEKALRVAL
ncbi:MAG: diacylglycerol kinase family lipid kinase [Saprospiraceae bacterium]|nr:diacylglycerol kinase family lipid kinase [Saprospiraceae bacterium]